MIFQALQISSSDTLLIFAASNIFFAGAQVFTVKSHERRITKIEEQCEKRAPLVTLFKKKEGIPL